MTEESARVDPSTVRKEAETEESPPPPPHHPPLLLLPEQTKPFSTPQLQYHLEEEEEAITAPELAITTETPPLPPHDKSPTLLHNIGGASLSGILLSPAALGCVGADGNGGRGDEGDEFDEMALISSFHAALSKACKAGKTLKTCREKVSSEAGADKEGGVCPLSKDAECQDESKDFDNKYDELVKYEKHLKEAYQKECDGLREELKGVGVQLKETERDHQLEMTTLARKHTEEVSRLRAKVDRQAHCLELQGVRQKEAEVAELKRLRGQYEDECREVEELRGRVAEKEKSLCQLRGKMSVMEGSLKRHLLTVSECHVQRQLSQCEQIGRMVRLLPGLGAHEIDGFVEDVSSRVEKMRLSSTNRRSTSWRH